MRNARRLQRLSGDILDVSKIESSLLKLSKSPIDLNEKIRTVINDIQNGYDTESNKNVKFFFQPKESITVYADRDRIYQVVSNLLNNAVKFTKNGTVTINTSLNHITNNHNKEAIVIITDTGSGIAPEIMPKLFSKFVTSSQTGTGLGLFISKGIIEAHGGRIWAENNDGADRIVNGDGNASKGATFFFTPPIDKD